MRKKIGILLFLALLVCFTVYAQQYCPESDFRAEPIDGGRAVRITGYLGTNWHVRIPPTIRGLPVTHIGSWAFYRTNLISVTIPNSVTHIEDTAFWRNQLTSVTIPNSTTNIGMNAFGRNQLTNISIPNSVTHIGGNAFRENQLTNVTIPNSVTEINGTAFRDNQLTSVTIPNSVTEIGAEAFMDNQLTSVTIPNSVTRIWTNAFIGNQITSITIGANVYLGLVRIGGGGWAGAGGLLEGRAFGNGFCDFYRSQGRRAGVYTWNGTAWSFRER